jgi:hypothetical protein
MIVHPFTCPIYCTSKSKGKFFHSMHEIYASKHPKKTPWLVDRQQLANVATFGSLRQTLPNTHFLAKYVCRLKACGIAYAYILIDKITSNSICKHENRFRAFLVWSEDNLNDGNHLVFEVRIMVPHDIKNRQDQLFGYPKSAREYVL